MQQSQQQIDKANGIDVDKIIITGVEAPMPDLELQRVAELLQQSCDKIGVDLSCRFQRRRDSSKATELQLIQRLARIKDELASIVDFAAQYEQGITSLDKMAETEAGQ